MAERRDFVHTYSFPDELLRDRGAFEAALTMEFERMQRMTLKEVVGFDVRMVSVDPMICHVEYRPGATDYVHTWAIYVAARAPVTN
jgi:hypothetical protein